MKVLLAKFNNRVLTIKLKRDLIKINKNQKIVKL